MNVFLFQNRFEAAILAGTKDCTIRAPRRDGRSRAKEGELISLRVWTGSPYRSKQREIARAKVQFLFPVRISKDGIHRLDLEPRWSKLSGYKMARSDGFANWSEMKAWFKTTHGLPFEGVLVHWRLWS